MNRQLHSLWHNESWQPTPSDSVSSAPIFRSESFLGHKSGCRQDGALSRDELPLILNLVRGDIGLQDMFKILRKQQ
jgi:hypothetical protein